MKVVLDANVLFSAFVVRGTCAQVLEAVISDHRLVVSEDVIADLRLHLARKVGADAGELAAFEAVLRATGEVVDPPALGESVSRDPDDDAILAIAVAAGADVIVTGDRDLNVLREYRGTPIVTPREFLRDHAHRDPS